MHYKNDTLSNFLLDLENQTEEFRLRIITELRAYINEDRRVKMENALSKRTQHLSLMLENIFQPQNASAVLRSCEGLGIQSVYITEDVYQYQVSPQVVMGADKWLDIHYVRDKKDFTSPTLHAYEMLRKNGYTIAATCWAKDSIPIHELPLDKPLALIFGTELNGLSKTAINNADIRTYIPMYGFTQSYNISVAAAMSMHTLRLKLENIHPELLPLRKAAYERIFISWMLASLRLGESLLQPFIKEWQILSNTK